MPFPLMLNNIRDRISDSFRVLKLSPTTAIWVPIFPQSHIKYHFGPISNFWEACRICSNRIKDLKFCFWVFSDMLNRLVIVSTGKKSGEFNNYRIHGLKAHSGIKQLKIIWALSEEWLFEVTSGHGHFRYPLYQI